MNYTSPKQTELTITRLIPASPAEVYDVWIDARSPGSPWFGCKQAILDARVDGLFYNCVSHEGRDWTHYGRFVALERPRRIAHTWVSEATRGLESMVTLTFEPEGAQTRVTLRHTGIPDDAFGLKHQDGWTFVLGSIEEQFAKRA